MGPVETLVIEAWGLGVRIDTDVSGAGLVNLKRRAREIDESAGPGPHTCDPQRVRDEAELEAVRRIVKWLRFEECPYGSPEGKRRAESIASALERGEWRTKP